MVGRNDGVTNGLRFFVKTIDSLDRRDCDAIHGRDVLAPVPRPIQEEQQRNGKYGQHHTHGTSPRTDIIAIVLESTHALHVGYMGQIPLGYVQLEFVREVRGLGNR